jgi:tetratricopeptide (TPR) repeat protein
MGKKSRRQRIAVKHSSNSSNGDENKNKSASNKWTTSSEEELADCVRRIFNKFDSVGVMNLETALALESEVLDTLREIGKQQPPRGGNRVNSHVHVKLANCFRAVDNPDACNKAVSHYRKAIDHEVKLVDDYEADIIRCYLDFDRCDEAMDAFKAFSCSHVENDTAIDPEFIMSIARRFKSKGGFVHTLRIQKLLSSFDLTVRSEALGEYRMAIDGYKSSLSISRDQNDKSAEAHALEALGRVYAKMHKNHTAVNRLQKALVIRMQLKTRVSISQMIDIYIQTRI